MDLKRRPDENEYEYVYRLGENKNLIGTWQDIADIINQEFGYEYTESRYRKMYQSFQKMMDGNQSRFSNSDALSNDLVQQKLDLEKERVRLKDERGELRRVIREEARRDNILDTVRDIIKSNVTALDGYEPKTIEKSDNDLIVHVTDIHTGLDTHNFANRFDQHILWDRLSRYIDKIIDVKELHCSENCYILLGGDLISGLIHSNLRLENNMNVIRQVKTISEMLCKFVASLSSEFNHIEIRSVPGNHSRCLPVKEDNLKGENLDSLVFWYMQAALMSYENIEFFDNPEDSIAVFTVRGNLVYGVHGDKDAISSVVQNLSLFLGEKPDIVLAGHRHKNGLTTVYDTKVVESGCISGPDNFCMDHRLRNRPEQMILVVNDKGIDCLYNVCLAD